MSNPIEELLKVIAQYLNIDMSDRNIIAIIEGDLKSLPATDLHIFLRYIKENSNNENMNFKTGFQKFNLLCENFKKQRVQLDNAEHHDIYKYTHELNEKVVTLFELIGDQLYKNNVSPFSDEGKKYLESENITNDITKYIAARGLQVVDVIGRGSICRLVRHSRGRLKDEISNTVDSLYKKRKATNLGYSPNQSLEYTGHSSANQLTNNISA